MWDGFYYGLQIWAEYVLYIYWYKPFQHVFGDQHGESKNLKYNIKQNISGRAICSDMKILTIQTGFCPLLNVFFTDLQINRWLHLSSSYLWNFLSRRLTQQKSRPEKCPFIATVLAVQWSVKYFFAPNSPFFRKSGEEKKKKKDNYEAFCFLSKRNKHV